MELDFVGLRRCVSGFFIAALLLGAPSGTPETTKGWLALLAAGLTYGVGLACLYEGNGADWPAVDGGADKFGAGDQFCWRRG